MSEASKQHHCFFVFFYFDACEVIYHLFGAFDFLTSSHLAGKWNDSLPVAIFVARALRVKMAESQVEAVISSSEIQELRDALDHQATL